jgi:hypothetical protein
MLHLETLGGADPFEVMGLVMDPVSEEVFLLRG